MDVAHAILFAKAIDISRVTADYSSAKFESIYIGWCNGQTKSRHRCTCQQKLDTKISKIVMET